MSEERKRLSRIKAKQNTEESDRYKKISFNGSYGTNEEQLNNLLSLQQDAPNFFWINQVLPMNDRGYEYFWIRYRGKFPEEKEWHNKK